MSELEFVALVLAAIGPLLALAKLTGVPPLFLLAGAGLGSAFLPGLPPVRADPQFLLSLFLPPLTPLPPRWLPPNFARLP